MTDRYDRRRLLKTVGAGGATVALAGCLSDDGPDEEPGADEEEPEEEETEEEPETEEELTSLEPAPDAVRSSLTNEEIQDLVAAFDDDPMNANQREVEGEMKEYTPRHVWKWVTDETLIGLHFDDPNPEETEALDYIVVGKKGLFTEESQPAPEFSHFHQHTADSWEAGHGGETGDEGYWLTHIAVDDIEYPFHGEQISPRVDYDFFPTPPEEGSEGHSTDFDSPDGNDGSITNEEAQELVSLFDDQVTSEGQFDSPSGEHTPRHVWKWVNEDVAMFLHWNEPEPDEATELDYFGIGVHSQFREGDRPVDTRGRDDIDGLDPDFSHFHKWEADSWEAGHGAQSEDQYGLWLVHHNVREVEYPFHEEPVDVGVDREFFPTPVDEA